MTRTRPCSVAVAFVLLACGSVLPASASTKHGSFTKHHYTAADPGLTRDYWIYRPSHLSARRVPLIVYLHGCTQDAKDAALGTRWNVLAEKKGFIAVYPDQRIDQSAEGAIGSRGNGLGCWNWFNPADQKRDGGEPATMAGIARRVIASYPIDRRRVFVMGASAGGDMAAILGANYPDLYAAIGVVFGCPFLTCTDVTGSSAYSAMGRRARAMPVFAVEGTFDHYNPFPLGVAMVQQWLGTDDFADDGALNGSVPRSPQSITHHGLDASSLARLGTVGDLCVRNSNWPCSGGALGSGSTYPYSIAHYVDAKHRSLVDFWMVYGLGHNYPGGDPVGKWTDPHGPDITSAAFEFFMAHPMNR